MSTNLEQIELAKLYEAKREQLSKHVRHHKGSDTDLTIYQTLKSNLFELGLAIGLGPEQVNRELKALLTSITKQERQQHTVGFRKGAPN